MMKYCVVAYLALWLAGCEGPPAHWDAFVYPNDDLFEVEEIRGFKTFDLCRAAAEERLRALRPSGGGSYECGFKCEPFGTNSDMKRCEETRD